MLAGFPVVASVVALVVFLAAYVLIATEKVNRVLAALGGAMVVLGLGIVGPKQAFFSADTGIDWNVIFLLFGMMIIVGILQHTGVFEFVAIWATKRAGGRPFRVMTLLCVITAVASMALDNVTTILLIAPVTLLVCERIGVRPVPFLIAEALASNIGGAATLIGDPPNLIVASRAGLSFNDFIVHLGPIVVVLLVIFTGLSRLLFRRDFVTDADSVAGALALDEREAIRDPRLLVKSLAVLAVVLAGFVLRPVLHLEPSVVALVGAGVLIVISRLTPRDYLRDVEWEALLFFAGLFVLVGSLIEVGWIDRLAHVMSAAIGGSAAVGMVLLLWASAVLSGVIDNIPYVATMAPVVQQLVASGPLEGQQGLWWALLLGADLGGNATAIGASANVVATGIARRNGHPISFWEFTKYGSLVAFLTVACCVPYLLLRY